MNFNKIIVLVMLLASFRGLAQEYSVAIPQNKAFKSIKQCGDGQMKMYSVSYSNYETSPASLTYYYKKEVPVSFTEDANGNISKIKVKDYEAFPTFLDNDKQQSEIDFTPWFRNHYSSGKYGNTFFIAHKNNLLEIYIKLNISLLSDIEFRLDRIYTCEELTDEKGSKIEKEINQLLSNLQTAYNMSTYFKRHLEDASTLAPEVASFYKGNKTNYSWGTPYTENKPFEDMKPKDFENQEVFVGFMETGAYNITRKHYKEDEFWENYSFFVDVNYDKQEHANIMINNVEYRPYYQNYYSSVLKSWFYSDDCYFYIKKTRDLMGAKYLRILDDKMYFFDTEKNEQDYILTGEVKFKLKAILSNKKLDSFEKEAEYLASHTEAGILKNRDEYKRLEAKIKNDIKSELNNIASVEIAFRYSDEYYAEFFKYYDLLSMEYSLEYKDYAILLPLTAHLSDGKTINYNAKTVQKFFNVSVTSNDDKSTWAVSFESKLDATKVITKTVTVNLDTFYKVRTKFMDQYAQSYGGGNKEFNLYNMGLLRNASGSKSVSVALGRELDECVTLKPGEMTIAFGKEYSVNRCNSVTTLARYMNDDHVTEVSFWDLYP